MATSPIGGMNLSTDTGGLGSMMSGIFGSIAKGTSQCGSRPICVGTGSLCAEKNKAYNECLQKDIAAKTTIQTNKMVIIVVGLISVVVVLSIILKNRR